jgi:peptide/nickel transport system permease protein
MPPTRGPSIPTPKVAARPGLARTPAQVFWREFRKSPTAVAGAGLLAALYAAALLAGFLAPYEPERQNLSASYQPPARVHWGARGPYVRAYELVDMARNRYAEVAGRRLPIRFWVRGPAYRLLGLVPADRHLFGVAAPGEIHLLGTDGFGRDVLSRLLYGARVSLSVGLIGIAITFTLGVFFGGLSGYFGGLVDEVVMRVTELILSIPGLYLIVALAGILPPEMPSDRRYALIIIILSFIGWAGLARIVRGMVLSLREREYVTAARALGAGTLRILFRHIVPNALSFLIVAATVSVPGYILGEVFLSFLGVGVQEPTASWGNMLTAAQSVRVLTSYPWVLTPGLLIFVTVLAFNFLGDGLADAFNPRKVQAGRRA